jgi:hypothetical protein
VAQPYGEGVEEGRKRVTGDAGAGVERKGEGEVVGPDTVDKKEAE